MSGINMNTFGLYKYSLKQNKNQIPELGNAEMVYSIQFFNTRPVFCIVTTWTCSQPLNLPH